MTQSTGSLKVAVIKGAGWAAAMRWSIRFIGLLSSAVLARLLTPEDYGLVAMAVVLIGLSQVFLEFGVDLALIQNSSATKAEFDTAWTIRILQSFAVVLVILLLAPHASAFYNDDRISEIFYISAVGVLLSAFENIGIVKFRKELQFSKDYQFYVLSKVLGSLITIALAFYYRSYYALVIGTVAQGLISTLLSYIVCQDRPSFSLSKWQDLWSFSKWILVKNFARYIVNKGDYLLLGKLAPITTLGFYRWGMELNSMVRSELIQPINRSIVPGYAKLQHDPERLDRAYMNSLNAIATLVVPVTLGIGAVASEFVPLLLGGGDKWKPVIPILQILSVAAFFTVFYASANNFLIVKGKIRHTAYVDMLRAALVLLTLFPAYRFGGVEGVAGVKILLAWLNLVLYYTIFTKVSTIGIADLVRSVWRPAIASVLMAAILYNISDMFDEALLLLLLFKVFCGALSYSFFLLLFWILCGRPDSTEKMILNFLNIKIKNLRATSPFGSRN